MRAKKISMIISVLLFVLGLTLACVFTFAKNIFLDWQQLLINLSLGISTGGLVAVLIEIPMAHSSIGANIRLLEANSLYVYMYSVQLIALIEMFCKDEKREMFDKFGSDVIEKIIYFSTPLLNLDSHMYFCKTKQKQILVYIDYINRFILSNSELDISLKIQMSVLRKKQLEAEMEASKKGEYYSGSKIVFSSDVRTELLEMKNKIKPLCDAINITMSLVLNKKGLHRWHEQKRIINDEIYSGYKKTLESR